MKATALISTVCLALTAASAPVKASLVGDVIHAQYLYPDPVTVFQDLGEATVGAATPTFPNILGSGVLDVNVTDSQIVFDWSGSGTASISSFNGLEFTDTTNAFTSASVDPASNTPGFGFSFSGGNVFVNLSGVGFASGENISIDVSTSTVPVTVPEPSRWVMMVLGFAALGFAGFRGSRRRIELGA